MVRRRSTVRFRNGAPLKNQVRSSLDSSHPTPRMGAVAVLGGIWEIVSVSGPTGLADRARPVGPRGSAGRCRVPRREPEACRTVVLGNALDRGPARWPSLLRAARPGRPSPASSSASFQAASRSPASAMARSSARSPRSAPGPAPPSFPAGPESSTPAPDQHETCTPERSAGVSVTPGTCQARSVTAPMRTPVVKRAY